MSTKTVTCEMCGREIPLRASIEVKIEGAVMRLCPSCYARYSMGRGSRARQEAQQPTASQIQRARPAATASQKTRQPRVGARIERYEVVKDYAERIRAAREAMGLSTKDLANLIRESENIVKRIESGKLVPTIELARRIEGVLKIQLVVPSVDQELEERGQPTAPGELTLGDVIQIRKRE